MQQHNEDSLCPSATIVALDTRWHHPRVPPVSPSLVRLGGALARAFVRLAWARAARRDYARLLAMSPDELSDIGLTRGDVMRARRRSLTTDCRPETPN